MKPTHLFFDLDGTVTDPRDGIVRSISHALTVLNRTPPEPESLERFIGPPLAQSFEELLGTTDPGVVRSAVDAYRERFAGIGILENRVYPEMVGVLNALSARGYVLYLVTSKPKVYADRIAEHFDLAKYFVRIYGPALDDLNASKRSLIARALTDGGLDPATVAVIGDRRDDVVGAKENGAGAIAVTWGYGSAEELNGADQTADSPAELLALLSAF